MTVAAIIPNFNGAERLARLLPDLKGQADAFVIDNGSTDDSAGIARDAGATVLQLSSNQGFAKAVNAGIQHTLASYGWIAILNNDIRVRFDFFQHLLEEVGAAWFAAPKILSMAQPDLIDGTYDLPTRAGTAYRAGSGQPDGPPFDQPREITSAPMTAALFRAELFTKVGMLDECFGSYLEDVDFGIRCALAGCKGKYVPAAVAYHEGSATFGGSWSPKSTRWISRNQALLARKFRADVWPALWGQLLWGILALRHGVLNSWLIGKIEGLRVPIKPHRHQNWGRVVLDSERQIAELQGQTGFDWYWRQYFRFAPLAKEDQGS
jgi:GT2 family glycosyltransferase